MKHSSRRGSKAAVSDFTPEELFAGQFVVFTVYALLELPPTVRLTSNKMQKKLNENQSINEYFWFFVCFAFVLPNNGVSKTITFNFSHSIVLAAHIVPWETKVQI